MVELTPHTMVELEKVRNRNFFFVKGAILHPT